jgi:putative glutathione S-transferase
VRSTDEFQREATQFRDRIRDSHDTNFQPTADRSSLDSPRADPWAHGTVLVRTLLGPQDVISMDVVDPYRE